MSYLSLHPLGMKQSLYLTEKLIFLTKNLKKESAVLILVDLSMWVCALVLRIEGNVEIVLSSMLCTENEVEMERVLSERMSHHQTLALKPLKAMGCRQKEAISWRGFLLLKSGWVCTKVWAAMPGRWWALTQRCRVIALWLRSALRWHFCCPIQGKSDCGYH